MSNSPLKNRVRVVAGSLGIPYQVAIRKVDELIAANRFQQRAQDDVTLAVHLARELGIPSDRVAAAASALVPADDRSRLTGKTARPGGQPPANQPAKEVVRWRRGQGPAAGTVLVISPSDDRPGPSLEFTAAEWRAFTEGVRSGAFDFQD